MNRASYKLATQVPDQPLPTDESWATWYLALPAEEASNNGPKQAGEVWLSSFVDSPSWPEVFQRASSHGPEERLAQIGSRWLNTHSSQRSPAIPFVMATLIRLTPTNEELVDQAQDWLRGHQPTTSGWTRVLWEVSQLHRKTKELVRLVFGWMDSFSLPGGRDASYGIQAALILQPNNERVTNLAYQWLDKQPASDPAVPFVLSTLVETRPDDQQATRVAHRWLEGHADSAAASFVLQRLLQAQPLDENARHLAYRWLEEKPATEPGTPYVLSALLQSKPRDEQARYLGYRWLEEQPAAEPGMPNVLSGLLRAAPDDLRGREFAYRFLDEQPPAAPGRNQVLQALLQAGPRDAHVVDLARQSVAWDARGTGSGRLVALLIASEPEDPANIEIAEQWLTESDPRKKGWIATVDALSRYESLARICNSITVRALHSNSLTSVADRKRAEKIAIRTSSSTGDGL
jgi:hypothetical protein